MRPQRTLKKRTQFESLKLLKLGRNIRALRQKKGWTQQELASASGIDQTHISTIECGRRRTNPSLLCVVKIAFALEFSMARVCAGIELR